MLIPGNLENLRDHMKIFLGRHFFARGYGRQWPWEGSSVFLFSKEIYSFIFFVKNTGAIEGKGGDLYVGYTLFNFFRVSLQTPG